MTHPHFLGSQPRKALKHVSANPNRGDVYVRWIYLVCIFVVGIVYGNKAFGLEVSKSTEAHASYRTDVVPVSEIPKQTGIVHLSFVGTVSRVCQQASYARRNFQTAFLVRPWSKYDESLIPTTVVMWWCRRKYATFYQENLSHLKYNSGRTSTNVGQSVVEVTRLFRLANSALSDAYTTHNQFGTERGNEGVLHNHTLQSHLVNLTTDVAESPQGRSDTTEANNNQEKIGYHAPIAAILLYPHGGKFADDYGPALTVIVFLLIVPFTFCACELCHRRSNWWGGLFWGLTLLCATLAGGSGSIGRLPWD